MPHPELMGRGLVVDAGEEEGVAWDGFAGGGSGGGAVEEVGDAFGGAFAAADFE